MRKLSPKTKRTLFLITFAVLLYAAVGHLGAVSGALRWIAGVLSPILIGLSMAFILNVLLSFLESKPFSRMSRSRKRPVRLLVRPLSMVLTYLFAFGLLALLFSVVIPDLYNTLIYIGEKLPEFAERTHTWLEALLTRFDISADILPDTNIDWSAAASTVKKYLTQNYEQIFGNAVNVTTSVAGKVANVAFAVIISGYVLAQKEKICRFTRRCVDAFVPEESARRLYHVADCTRFYFSRFIGGQLVEAVILGTLCFLGMTVLRLPNAAVVSLVICVTALIPVVGATVGLVVGFFLILITSPLKALIFVAFLLVLQQIENNLIYPRVVGKSVGLPGVITICAVLVGANIGGVTGAFLGVPTCAVLYVLLREAIDRRTPAPQSSDPEQAEAPPADISRE